MMHTRVWLCLALGCLGTTARYLPTPELIVDSLVPFSGTSDTSRAIRSVEGSGDGDGLVPIQPMPLEQSIFMERLESAPTETSKPEHLDDEGSGAEPVEIGGMLKDIDDPIEDTFAKEPGMHEVLEDLNKPSGLPREDDNRQGNSLNVLPSEDRPETRHDDDEGSGLPDLDAYDTTNVSIIDLDNEKNTLVNNETISQSELIHAGSDEDKIVTTVLPPETTLAEEIPGNELSSDIPVKPDDEVVSKSEITTETTTHETEPATPVDIVLHIEEPEISAAPDTVTLTPELVTSKPVQAVESSTDESMQVTGSAQPIEVLQSSPAPSSEVEILKKTDHKIVMTSANEATVLETSVGKDQIEEASGPKSLSTFIIIGGLIVAFMCIIIAVVMRNRRKRRNLQDESNTDADTGKALLANGKYKPDTEDVKNNEISPLVINKFEKSPNFSSQKNLNTAANDKNIEKDNVLKQAIIEDEVDEAKKALEGENGDCKKAAEDLRGDLEKVVVRTHFDLDSIPRKPLLVTKNGNTYHSVPNGET